MNLPISPKLALSLFFVGAAALAATSIAVTAPATRAASDAASATCTKRQVPGQPPKHTQNLKANGKWNSFPPSSGLHYELSAKFNWYSQPIPQIVVVHNLEHGGVAVSYGNRVAPATLAKIRSWYLKDTNGVLVTPLPKLGKRIALTAWNAPPYAGTNPDPGRGIVLMCSGFDAKAFSAFRAQHRYKAGERFPKPNLARQQ
jgi:hypothetical protein